MQKAEIGVRGVVIHTESQTSNMQMTQYYKQKTKKNYRKL